MSDLMSKYEIPREELPGKKGYLRFPVPYRFEHWLFMATFTTLGLTGLIQKYSQVYLSQLILRTFGGIENTRQIHHIAATIMMFVVIYHIGSVGYRLIVRRVRPTMLPLWLDVTNAVQTLGYNVGLRKHQAQQDRYTFEEKLEYWAVVWGTIIMGLTGFMMWNPILTTSVMNGEVIPAAKVAHGLEAVLAILSILIWHMYSVFIKYFNKAMYIGYISEHEMLEEHPIELANIKAGIEPPRSDKEVIQKRRKYYIPIYTALAIVMAIGIYFFVGYEVTAISTIPPAENIQVFVPLTPTPLPTPLPTATPAPIETVTWEGGIGEMLNEKCGDCHNSTLLIAELDLSTYESALVGGKSGPAIVPGDPDKSQLIVVQSPGNHPGQLTIQELNTIIEWIEEEAPAQ